MTNKNTTAINIFNTQKRVTLSRIPKGGGKFSYVIMEAITEQQEKVIDRSALYYGDILFHHPDGFDVDHKHIYMYGSIDLDNDSDLDIIENFNLIDEVGGWMYSNCDMATGDVIAKNRKFTQYQTWDCIKWFEYNYCLLGRPERIIVYKTPEVKAKVKYGNKNK